MSFSASRALTEDGESLILQTPPRFWIQRGLVLLLLVPGLLVVLIGLFALLELLQGGGPGLLTAGVAVVAVLVGGPCALVGLWHLARATANSAASRVEIDRGAAEIRPAGAAPVPTAAVVDLELCKPRAMQKWHQIVARTGPRPEARAGEGPYRPPREGDRVVLVGNLNELELRGARALLARLGDELGCPVHDRSSSLLGGGGADGVGLAGGPGRALHAATYVPVQGIFLLASAFALVARRDDPVAQFHARQSMAFVLLEVPVLLGTVAVGVGLMLLADQLVANTTGAPHPLALLAVVHLVLVVALVRVAVRFMAAYRAWRGVCWVIPGFGWASRRWLPPAPPTGDYQA